VRNNGACVVTTHFILCLFLSPSLPPLSPHQRPKPIIEYAKTTRQAVLKYLAVLRWKTTVDLATTSAPSVNGTGAAGLVGPAASFPTPHSNGESNNTSPTAFPPSKGKARAGDAGAAAGIVEEARGKVTDARRIQQFLEHQNVQHEAAIAHIQHVTKLVDTLRCVDY
jgi:mediator of RNA polymerase II transcription subunit 14